MGDWDFWSRLFAPAVQPALVLGFSSALFIRGYLAIVRLFVTFMDSALESRTAISSKEGGD